MRRRFLPDRLRPLRASVDDLARSAIFAAQQHAAQIDAVPADRRPSAVNLAHYLAVRAHDLRLLQRELASCSLSSLGRMEANVMDTLDGLREALGMLLGEQAVELPQPFVGPDMVQAEHLLAQHTIELLGPRRPGRRGRIMVTLPSEATGDRVLLRELMQAGMDIVRINLAHDGPDAWTAMVDNLRAVESELSTRCRVLVDLPGPKLRTGDLEEGPRVVRVRPQRDALGVVVVEAGVTFVGPEGGAVGGDPESLEVPLVRGFGAMAHPGDEIVVVDTRGRERSFLVREVAAGAWRTTTDRTVYVGTDCAVELRRGGDLLARTRIGPLPARASYLPLVVGDMLRVTRDPSPGRPAGIDDDGRPGTATIPCTLPEVFLAVHPGERVLFDDGKIAGVVVECGVEAMLVRITEVPPGGGRLKAEKGINLPDSDLHLAALTDFDRSCLDWVADHADIVGMSFVQRAADVLELHDELARRGRADLGIVLKIETKKAFQRLPELLFAGLRSPPLGLMVARGDLAVEVGFARLAEVQEEILWLCEAAHLPVVWATQVLDSMARTGVPSRAEVTDAAAAVRAECVMLNKGPHIVATTAFLSGVLERMADHHDKKRAMLRRLRVVGEH